MEFEIGRKLIEDAIDQTRPQVWADLGAGSGFFTKILDSLLAHESLIYAIDHDQKVKSILGERISVKPIVADIVSPPNDLEMLDGIMLANALHYVEDKISFLEVWSRRLNDDGFFLIVEYDTEEANQWVPYPVSFESLHALGKKLDAEVILINTTPSVYHAGGIYSSIFRKK
ncbi:class I SAM-dependent methyltransferase [Pseudochryseolinea flava]|uniref:Methyltransferase type 11 domain-containing protein n=1 Tax=Pseudochryseolinea flava TaxID=2059302 RepID=A0A364Y9B4_9BACT|nr:methyltransferase domain-containing protein [Pseudochryseolinea flava]RAW02959.1 hypothetical protein DQQ10_02320 [Pseudochryseolinea flava]